MLPVFVPVAISSSTRWSISQTYELAGRLFGRWHRDSIDRRQFCDALLMRRAVLISCQSSRMSSRPRHSLLALISGAAAPDDERGGAMFLPWKVLQGAAQMTPKVWATNLKSRF